MDSFTRVALHRYEIQTEENELADTFLESPDQGRHWKIVVMGQVRGITTSFRNAKRLAYRLLSEVEKSYA